MNDALVEAGWVVPMEARKSCLHQLVHEPMDVRMLGWMLDQDMLSPQWIKDGVESRQRPLSTISHSLARALQAEGDEEKALLEKFVRLGIVGGENPLLGASKLVMQGAFQLADLLIERGHPLRPCALDPRWGLGKTTVGPIEGYFFETVRREQTNAFWVHQDTVPQTPFHFEVSQALANTMLENVRQLVK